MKTLQRLLLFALISLAIGNAASAQSLSTNFADSYTDYKVQVRMTPGSTRAAKLRWPTWRTGQTRFSIHELAAGQTGQDYVDNYGGSSQPSLVSEYSTNPAPTIWYTVQVVDTYSEAEDIWYEINAQNSNVLEIRIQSTYVDVSQNTLPLSPVYGGGTSTSTSLMDYYYDYRIKLSVYRSGTGYLIDTKRSRNRIILKTFTTYADYVSYMALNSNYDLVESLPYLGRFTEWHSVSTASTYDDAQEMADFIMSSQSGNQLYGDNVRIEPFWNP